jgi:predicted permease
VIEDAIRDLRYAAKSLAARPGFFLSAVAVLAIGIGANAAIFGVLNATFLVPLGGAAPGRLVEVYTSRGAVAQGDLWGSSSYPDFERLRDLGGVFSAAAAEAESDVSLSTGGEPIVARASLISADWFRAMAVVPASGRAFTADEERAARSAPVTVVSNGLWKRVLASDPAVVGRAITVNGTSFTVLGVLPESFTGSSASEPPDLYVPITLQATILPRGEMLRETGARWLRILGRLNPGMTIDQAQAAADLAAASLASEAAPEDRRLFTVVPASRVPRSDHGDITAIFGILSAVVGLILLLACANVANLLLARGVSRRKEIAVRLALGAGRGRLVRQLLAESVLLSFAGGGAGLLLALWAGDLLPLPLSIRPTLDARVLAYAIGVSGLTAVLFGLAPSLRSSRSDVVSALKGDADGGVPSRLQGGFVIAQVSISMVLLIAAGLFLRSVSKAEAIDPGFDKSGVVAVSVDPTLLGYDAERSGAFFQRLLERSAARPEIAAAAAAWYVPLGGTFARNGFDVEGQPPSTDREPRLIGFDYVSSGYFATLGMPVLIGRDFAESDGPSAPRVAIVNETFARRYWEEGNPIGRRISIQGEGASSPIEVVGVARDSRVESLTEDPRPYIYLPYRQGDALGMTILARAAGSPAAAAAALREEVRALDRNLPVTRVAMLSEFVADSDKRKTTAGLLALFGAVALLLAAVGLHGVVAFGVSRRTREIGVRVALGARPADVARMVLSRSLRVAGIGVCVGVVVSLALTRLLSSQLFGVTPTDLGTFAAVAAILTATSALASWLPAARAARVDPLKALRCE